MSSKTTSPAMHSAAWRISLWAVLAFAFGTMLVFVMLHRFLADDIQRRTDAWISGEVEVLGDVADRTPKDSLYQAVVGEIAELASREVPDRTNSDATRDGSVFFMQIGQDGSLGLWVGSGDKAEYLRALRSVKIAPYSPFDIEVTGVAIPFRVASDRLGDGSVIYLGISERDQRQMLRTLRTEFISLWLLIVLLGFSIVFFVTRRMLGNVRKITEAASRIGQSDLGSRVPESSRNDEVGHLSRTLNHMLDRIENSVHQLHTITDSLAHDLRSPLTAIRGKLEAALSEDMAMEKGESIVSAIEELDRFAEFLNTSLDVAEAKADALRLTPCNVDLDDLLRSMIDLYEPSMAEKGIRVELRSAAKVNVMADPALLHRVIANLLDNELRHLSAASTVCIRVRAVDDLAELIVEDDGPGFDRDLGSSVFEQRVKGKDSKGHGLGLAFVAAVVRAHGGDVSVANRPQGGARLSINWPLATVDQPLAVS